MVEPVQNFYFKGTKEYTDKLPENDHKYIVLQNDDLHRKNDELNKKITEINSERDELENDNESLEKSNTRLKGLIKNEGELNREYIKLVNLYETELKHREKFENSVRFVSKNMVICLLVVLSSLLIVPSLVLLYIGFATFYAKKHVSIENKYPLLKYHRNTIYEMFKHSKTDFYYDIKVGNENIKELNKGNEYLYELIDSM